MSLLKYPHFSKIRTYTSNLYQRNCKNNKSILSSSSYHNNYTTTSRSIINNNYIYISNNKYLNNNTSKVMTKTSDPSSYSNVMDYKIKSIYLSLDSDFTTNVLSGYVDLNINNITNTKFIILDTKDLTIDSIKYKEEVLNYKLGEYNDIFGSSLTISLSDSLTNVSDFTIRITYSTSPSASAIQWLPKEQTAGKMYPYLFTQCQAIHCRSLIPIADSPFHKFTYKADITVPDKLVALMSALRVDNGNYKMINNKRVYSFEQPIVLPSYLVALAIGKLESKKIGPRSSIWCEKEMLDAGAYEFAETEQFLTAAEDICGPYVWGIYDILLLPPSFPYGGMENPCLTFVTPTLLAGDRSLAGVVAHEIAHSWMGNLVTNKTWESFWMNEGFCVFVERKIYQRMFGRPYAGLKACIGLKGLQDCVEHFGSKHDYTCLCPHLEGVDPDDAFSSVPYEKGFSLLMSLQEIVGEEKMDAYLKAHCIKYGHQCVDCYEWAEWFTSYFAEQGIKIDMDWGEIFTTPGMPKSIKIDESLAQAAIQLSEAWLNGTGPVDGINGWKASQTVVFLEKVEAGFESSLQNKSDSEKEQIKAEFREKLKIMDSYYKLNEVINAEIRFCWQILCIRSELEYVYPNVVKFMTEQGRMKFTRPLYRELNKVSTGKELAKSTFEKHRTNYHSICSKMVAKDLGL